MPHGICSREESWVRSAVRQKCALYPRRMKRHNFIRIRWNVRRRRTGVWVSSFFFFLNKTTAPWRRSLSAKPRLWRDKWGEESPICQVQPRGYYKGWQVDQTKIGFPITKKTKKHPNKILSCPTWFPRARTMLIPATTSVNVKATAAYYRRCWVY